MDDITCQWCDRYTASYRVRMENYPGCLPVHIVGKTAEAQALTRRLAGLPQGADLPDPRPYTPPAPRGPTARPLDPEAVARSEAYIAASKVPHPSRVTVTGDAMVTGIRPEAMPRTAHDALPGDNV